MIIITGSFRDPLTAVESLYPFARGLQTACFGNFGTPSPHYLASVLNRKERREIATICGAFKGLNPLARGDPNDVFWNPHRMPNVRSEFQ